MCEIEEAADISVTLDVDATAPQDAARAEEEAEPPWRGAVIIEWPPAHGTSPLSAMAGHQMVITDAYTGKPVRTCLSAVIKADAESLVTADLTLFADAAGEPILDGEPVTDGDGFRTGVFPFLVAEMRVRAAD